MTTKLDAVAAQAMKLDSRSRARLAKRLIQSLDGPSGAAIERAWAEEADRRVTELRGGVVTARPAADVLKRVRREISRKRSRSIR
jgi:putative addiction module component (TIGR02574 family)